MTDEESTEWEEADSLSLRSWIYHKYGIVAKSSFADALEIVLVNRKRNIHKEFLKDCPEWDGVERIKNVLYEYMGADRSQEWIGRTLELLMIAAVRRKMKATVDNPVKFDHAIILLGEKGIGKTWFWSKLFNEFDAPFNRNVKSDEALYVLDRSWALNFDEMGILRENRAEDVKEFITKTKYQCRTKYKVESTTRAMTSVFVGTTNDSTLLEEDDRRFIVVNCDEKTIKENIGKGFTFDKLEEIVPMLWAEAIEKEKTFGKLKLKDEDLQAISEQRKMHISSSPIQDELEAFFDAHEKPAKVCIKQLIDECFKRKISKEEKHDIDVALRNIGYSKCQNQSFVSKQYQGRRDAYILK